MNNHQLLTTSQAAEILQVSRRQVGRLIDSRQIKVVTLGQRTRRIRRQDLEAFIEKSCRYENGEIPGKSMSRSTRDALDKLLGEAETTHCRLKLVSDKN